MKKQVILTILAMMLANLGLTAQTTWDFTTVSTSDQNLLSADNTNWSKDSNNRFCNNVTFSNAALMANGSELDWAKGLLFTCSGTDQLRIDPPKKRGWIGGSTIITIPNLKKGQTVSFNYMSSKTGEARGVTPTNSALISDFFGRTHYSLNFSIINTNLLIASFASTIAGKLYDSSGSYMSTIIMMLGVVAAGLVVFLGIRRPEK